MSRQQRWSRAFDRVFMPASFCVGGNRDFTEHVVPRHLRKGMRVVDVGGGKRPCLARTEKERLALTVVGMDIDAAELAKAPRGSYDREICADIGMYKGDGDADLVICQAVLEHVTDTEQALRSMASCLKCGGKALLFVPSRHAAYARLGMILPERLKRWIIRRMMPESAHMRGFKAYYDRCTPRQFRAMAERCGFEVEEVKCYYTSSYFSHFFPAHVVWRLWIGFFYFVCRENAAETFTLALRKR